MRTLRFVSVAAIPLIAALALGAGSAHAAPTAASCSVALIATEVPLELSPAGVSVGSAAVSAFRSSFPTAATVDTMPVTINAPTDPALNGRQAAAFLFQDPTLQPAGGPQGAAGGMVRVACGVAFYDVSTGEFLGDIKLLEKAESPAP